MGFFSELFNKHVDRLKPPAPLENPPREPARAESALEKNAARAQPPASPPARQRQPVPDSEVKLLLGDIIHRIPSHFLKPGPHDLKRALQFDIHDLFSDIARGRATVPLSKIAKLCPDIFREQIGLGQDVEVHLPLQKLVEQIGPMHYPATEKKSPQIQPALKAGPPPSALKADSPANSAAQSSSAGSPSSRSPEVSESQPPMMSHDRKSAKPKPEMVSLRLSAISPTIPQAAFIGELEPMDDSVRITLPFHLVESQMPSGKVELSVNDFIDAVPAEYRINFARGATVSIPIPIEEIQKSLSGELPPLTPPGQPTANLSNGESDASEMKNSAGSENTKPIEIIEPAPSKTPEPPVVAEVAESSDAGSLIHSPNPEGVAENSPAPPMHNSQNQEKSLAVEPVLPASPPPAAAPEPTSETVLLDSAPLVSTALQSDPDGPAKTIDVAQSEKTETREISVAPANGDEVLGMLTSNSGSVRAAAIPHALNNAIHFPQSEIPSTPQAAVATLPAALELRAELPHIELRPDPVPPPLRPITVHAPQLFASPQEPVSEFASETSFNALQSLLETTENLNPGTIAQLICQFPGISACVIVGKKQEPISSGAIPFDFDIDTFRLVFPSLVKSIHDHAIELNLGQLQNFTLDCERFSASLFPAPGLCLCVFHNDRALQPALRDKLVRIADALARVR